MSSLKKGIFNITPLFILSLLIMDTNFTDTNSSIQCSLTKPIFAKNIRLEIWMALKISMKLLEETSLNVQNNVIT